MWIVFDLETSGFRGLPMFSQYHEILQIAARTQDDRRFCAFVKPENICSIPPQSTAIHNIRDEDLEGAVGIRETLQKMFDHFGIARGDRVRMIAHNNKWFDCPQLRRFCDDILWKEIEFFDTLPWIRHHDAFESNALASVYESLFGALEGDMHRADVDVDALHRIYKEHVLPKLGDHPPPPEPTDDSPLGEMRFIGPKREATIRRYCGAETIGQFKKYMRSVKAHTWLRQRLKVFDVTHRMVIMSQITGTPLHLSPTLVPRLRCDAFDNVDYYVACRYGVRPKHDFDARLYAAGLANLVRISKQ